MALSESFVSEGLALVKECKIFGVNLESLSRDELLAAAAIGWKSYNDHLESSINSMALMRDLRARDFK
jgi:hypothetical protein